MARHIPKRVDNALLAPCLAPTTAAARWTPSAYEPSAGLELQRQWQAWRERIVGSEQNAAFRLGFRLAEPPTGDDSSDRGDSHEDNWRLHFVAIAADDPSHHLPLADYWAATESERAQHRARFGADFEQYLLLNLGLAARMVPMLWGGLDSAEPQSVALDLDDAFEVDPKHALAAMLERLRDHSQLQPVDNPSGLHADLRDYQKRGLAWLGFLEGLGLNGCLADDMGLGKTMQVIARLLQERVGPDPIPPTLLVAPTSVIGNWQKEVQRFAPGFSAWIHHGAKREQDTEAFRVQAAEHDLVITSYALVRRDQRVLTGVDWHRVVLDEAQNIKNPKADQTRAVLKLPSRNRLALTGTPVENRIIDLWSIFNFVNPGYLDTQPRFRKRFELPVQRDDNPVQTAILKRLVEPFILRRVKTDKSIIADLPDKLEAIAYCNLSREQLRAALSQTPLGHALQGLTDTGTPEPLPTDSYFTRPQTTPTSPDYQAFWHGAKRLPRELPAMRPAELPAIVIRKGGDYPAFWDKDASFIEVMEELYLRVREKSKTRL